MPNQIPYWIPLASALIGGALVAVINFVMRWQDRKSEERRHFQELLFKTAVEEWKQHCSMATDMMKTGRKNAIAPLVTYLVYITKVSEVLIEQKLTKENLSIKFAEIEELMNELRKFTMPLKKENE